MRVSVLVVVVKTECLHKTRLHHMVSWSSHVWQLQGLLSLELPNGRETGGLRGEQTWLVRPRGSRTRR